MAIVSPLVRHQIAAEHPVFAAKTHQQVSEHADQLRRVLSSTPSLGGVRLAQNGSILVASPLQPFRVAETRFFIVEGQRWSPKPGVALQGFPFREDYKAGDIVPIAGDIYIGERKLTDPELASVGLHAIKDENGNNITHPYLCTMGTRVIMDTKARNIYVFGKLDETDTQYRIGDPHLLPFIPRTVDDLTPYVLACLDMSKNTSSEVEENIRRSLATCWDSIPKEEQRVALEIFSKRMSIPFMSDWICGVLHSERLAYQFPSCSLQFKGSGANFAGWIAKMNALGEFPLAEGETIIKRGTDENGLGAMRAIVGYPKHVDKFGIFLDRVHQPPPASADPVGGMIISDTLAIQRDRELFSAGAKMAGFSISAIQLLEEERIRSKLGLTSYRSGDLYVLARAAGNDTRRLAHLKSPEFYRVYIEESYGSDFESGREKHLLLLAKNLGHNILAVLKCNLTTKHDTMDGIVLRHATANNLNPQGKIYDSTELVPTPENDKTRAGEVIIYWLLDYIDVAKAAGLSTEEFVGNGKYLEAILEGVLGQKIKLPERVLQELRNTSESEIAGQTTLSILYSLRALP